MGTGTTYIYLVPSCILSAIMMPGSQQVLSK